MCFNPRRYESISFIHKSGIEKYLIFPINPAHKEKVLLDAINPL